ncbi:MAG: hypothetical protein ABI675_10355 [Chitinophagaceae bacterium]
MKLVSLSTVFLIMGLCIVCACSKGGGGGTPPPAEANLAVTTDPANGSVQIPALGPYNLKVSISSTMPSNGVKIEINAKKDDGTNTVFFTASTNKTTAVSDFTITGTPAAAQCLVEVKVTSLTKATNIWSGSYRYSSK